MWISKKRLKLFIRAEVTAYINTDKYMIYPGDGTEYSASEVIKAILDQLDLFIKPVPPKKRDFMLEEK